MDSLSVEIENLWQEMQEINDQIIALKAHPEKHARRIRRLIKKFNDCQSKLIDFETLQFIVDQNVIEFGGNKND